MNFQMMLLVLGGSPSGNPSNPIAMFMPIFLIFIVMYFFMIRPQMKRQKQHQAMLAAIEKGDKIITSGGIYGKVVNVKEKSLVVQIADNTRIEVLKSAIGQKLEK